MFLDPWSADDKTHYVTYIIESLIRLVCERPVEMHHACMHNAAKLLLIPCRFFLSGALRSNNENSPVAYNRMALC